jgi:hypothetical protein
MDNSRKGPHFDAGVGAKTSLVVCLTEYKY